MEQCDLPRPQTRLDRIRKVLPRVLPFLTWWPMVNRRTLRADLWAGLTGAVIVLPQGVAFAAIAGLPPVYGLYAAMLPVIAAALFGSSHHLISGPTTAISLVVFTTVSQLAVAGSPDYIRLVLALTVLAGLAQLGLGLARLGGLVNFVSHSVVTGFTAGAAVLILTSQLGHFFGVTLPRGGEFLETWWAFLRQIPAINWRVAGIAAATLGLALGIRRLWPKAPALLLALIGGSVVCQFLDGAAHGARLVGALPANLPPFSLPEVDLETFRVLFPGALAVAMLGLAEAVSIARAVAVRSEQRIDNSQEFIGQGLANILGGFFSGYASSGSFTRTGVNFEAGAKTPLAAVFSAVFLAAVLLCIAPVTAYLPIAAMAGVIVLVAANLVNPRAIRHIATTDKAEAGILATTFLATLFVGLEFALYAGVMLSLLLYLRRTSHPHFITLAPDPALSHRSLVNVRRRPLPECPQLKILRLDGSIFFGAVNHITEELHRIVQRSPEQCHILIIGSGINFIDAGGCHMLFHEAGSLRLSGREIFFCSLKSEVMKLLTRGGCLARIGAQNVFRDKASAIAGIVARLDPERCACCRERVFAECASRPGGEAAV
ncbi:SulP family inorganic anion transporter [Solidesulfovibrio sp.]|jgi:SulP family sulfate permease|uniref:SulP family inorganic anion transporter n=1 Tax=Solidesulfovibrio sp. TaxID=2910990 RepID=UPI002B212E4F|nr:SulP family inorganic anion transporter [Solidesulfovibrio sp.]MEA5090274.1 SulP family inorganic anion transporter [Solidesulfovibrio sp.]HML62217.1 SulP family inorganic anion transporter [Solidesulfovibrio sp.]